MLQIDVNRKPDGSGFTDYVWDIIIPHEIAGEGPMGCIDIPCTMHYSLFKPEPEAGRNYPLVIVPGGVGDYAVRMTSTYAQDKWQAYCPCYVLHVSLPYEGVVNWESQMYCMGQFAEIVRAVSSEFGNVDMNRIYSTGGSQGAIWSYMLEGAAPGFYAGLFINAGTMVHTTWMDRQNYSNFIDVPLLIVHGTWDTGIPINEAYRVYNNLKALGKQNMALITFDVGHIVHKTSSVDGTPTPMMKWLFAQSKEKSGFEGKEFLSEFVDCTGEGPWLYEAFSGEKDDYSDTLFAGLDAYSRFPGWNNAVPYARWKEPHDNPTWDAVKELSRPLHEGESNGKYVVGKFRLGDEGTTSYDNVKMTFFRPINSDSAPGAPDMPPAGGPAMPPPAGPGGRGEMPPPSDGPMDNGKTIGMGTGPRNYDEAADIGLCAGDILCMTMQGFTGWYGDDLAAFNREFDVEWAVAEGDVSDIRITDEASPVPVSRPDTVTLDHGKGPSRKGSLGTSNVLDGRNVYLRIAVPSDFTGNRLMMYVRFIKKFPDGECAAYIHTICVKVNPSK